MNLLELLVNLFLGELLSPARRHNGSVRTTWARSRETADQLLFCRPRSKQIYGHLPVPIADKTRLSWLPFFTSMQCMSWNPAFVITELTLSSLFDMDGTLVDSTAGVIGAWEVFRQSYPDIDVDCILSCEQNWLGTWAFH